MYAAKITRTRWKCILGSPAIKIEEILRGRVEKFLEWEKNKAIKSKNRLLVYFNKMAKKFEPGVTSVFPNL